MQFLLQKIFEPQIVLPDMKIKSKISHLAKKITFYLQKWLSNCQLKSVAALNKGKNCIFLLQTYFAPQIFLAHMKIKSKLMILGKKIHPS